MVSKKRRRHSGWVTPQPTLPKKVLAENDLFLELYYNEWVNYRDGLRNQYPDFKKIKKLHHGIGYHPDSWQKRICMNNKQKRLLKRRKMMKTKREFNLRIYPT